MKSTKDTRMKPGIIELFEAVATIFLKPFIIVFTKGTMRYSRLIRTP